VRRSPNLLTVAAKTSDERGMKNIALFLLDRSTMRGITLGKAIDKMSVRASVTGEILLEDVEVPVEHLLGGETGGVEKIGGILSEIRVMTAAISVGLARAAYGAAVRYARERVAFGKPIAEHQAIGFKLADMLTSLHAALLMTYQAAARLDAGRVVTREAAMTKLFASETAVRITDEAARIFASYGWPRVSGPAVFPGRAIPLARRRHLRDPARHHRSRSRLGPRRGVRLTAGRRSRGTRPEERGDASTRALLGGVQGR